ncbi:hypothetical protein EV186_1021082 [Labedaea rhizosphaerae]|uniref:Phosphotransferase family enzyme n=1 Tax=Labedaea rhizosphaerae TaxID=598644 RepID=A0A4R6SHD9_LABRH|nr:hypothetical protein [Labedaea rhizosphaerae]TDQ01214.1 hypothetical protein EV186_1021082 [Labedaea rhizosphaerae]
MEIAADPPDTGKGSGGGEQGVGAALEVVTVDEAVDDTVRAAEKLLAKRFGSRIALAEPQDLGGSERSIVLRVRVAETPFALPRTMVLKRYVAEPSASFVREAVSYQLFTALAEDDRMCPELFAHDGEMRLLVIEDLGRAPTLAEKLRGADARVAERALLSWARSLGKLHATTAGREADFDALGRRLTSMVQKDPLAEQGMHALDEVPALLEAKLGVATPDPVLQRATQSTRLLSAPGHRAFSPSDSCPDNNLLTSRGVRFLDFEGGCIRSILVDAACLRVPFATCWCANRLPRGMAEAMLAAWRAEVRTMWPDIDDDAVFLPALLDAQLFWVWLATWRFLSLSAAQDSWVDGAVPGPPRIVVLTERWRDLCTAARQAGADRVAVHASAVVAALEKDGGAEELPLYPAFRD